MDWIGGYFLDTFDHPEYSNLKYLITWTIPLSVTTYDIRFPFSLAFFFPFSSCWKLYLVRHNFQIRLTSSSSFFFFSLTFWTSLASIVFGFFNFSSSSSCGRNPINPNQMWNLNLFNFYILIWSLLLFCLELGWHCRKAFSFVSRTSWKH